MPFLLEIQSFMEIKHIGRFGLVSPHFQILKCVTNISIFIRTMPTHRWDHPLIPLHVLWNGIVLRKTLRSQPLPAEYSTTNIFKGA